MATAVARRVQRASTPEAIDADLVALWREVADGVPFARAVMSNLIVFRVRDDDGEGREADDALLDEVMANHPSRTVVLEHDRSGDAPPLVGADVSVCIFDRSGGPYGVEKICVRSSCAEAALPSIVRHLLRGDIPTSLWWTEDVSRIRPLAPLVKVSRQVVFDSRGWRDVASGIRALAPIVADGRTDLADVNWQRLTAFRQSLALAASTIASEIAPLHARIAHRAGEASLAWLLAGWLASRLEWPARTKWPEIHEGIDEPAPDEVLKLTLGVARSEIDLTMNDHRVLVRRAGVAPHATAVPRFGAADAIAAELRALSRDAALHDTLRALVGRIVQS